MRSWTIALCLAGGTLSPIVSAQTQPTPPTPPAQTPPAQTPPPSELPPPPPSDEESDRALVDQASELIARGRPFDARRLLDLRLAAEPRPRYSVLPVLQRLAGRMAAPRAGAPIDPSETAASSTSPAVPERRSSLEAVELYATGLMYGATTGIWLDVLAEVRDIKAIVWLPILGAGLGATGAWLLDGRGHPVRPGFATAVNTGFQLGLGLGLALSVELEENLRTTTDCGFGFPCSRRSFSDEAFATTAWAGATLGVATGAAVAVLARPTPASGSYVYMGGLWGGVLGLMVALQVDDDDHLGAGMLVGGSLGVAATLATAGALRPSQAQVGWTHLGIVCGGLLGTGVAVLAFQNARTATGPLAAVEIGMIGGGVAGWILGAPDTTTPARRSTSRLRFEPAITPVPGGATVGFNLPTLL